MQRTDRNQPPDTRLIAPVDIVVALGLLTRLAVPVNADAAQARGARAAWAYPLAGAAVGGLGAVAALIAQILDLPATLAAGLILATMIAASGALHEDGLADTADGFWGGWDTARRLQIMKDSHIGSYGTIALILSLGLRWAALSALFDLGNPIPAILAAAILSRAPMVAVMAALPHARDTGLSRLVGRPPGSTALLAAGVALAAGLLLLGASALTAAAILVPATLGLAAIARAKIGGQTGDVLGATQQIGEIAVLATLAALA